MVAGNTVAGRLANIPYGQPEVRLETGIYVPNGTERPLIKFQDLLLSSLIECENQQRDKGFFPNSTFTTLVNEDIVGQELRRYRELRRIGAANLDRLTQRICGHRPFKRIFALLVLVNKASDIEAFIADDIADGDLPLCKVSRPGSYLFGLARQGDSRNALRCFETWGPSFIRSFEEWQWTVLAPTFEKGQRRDVKHVVLSHKHPLPFTKDSRLSVDDRISQGGHSTVFKVEIHPEHHNFSTAVVSQPPIKFLRTRISMKSLRLTSKPRIQATPAVASLSNAFLLGTRNVS